jgi:hypothetical protein
LERIKQISGGDPAFLQQMEGYLAMIKESAAP